MMMIHTRGSFNIYVDKIRGGGGQKMSVFVHAQGIKTVHAGHRGRKGIFNYFSKVSKLIFDLRGLIDQNESENSNFIP